MSASCVVEGARITDLSVLCVEDESVALEVMQRYLLRQGARVMTATNGAEGLNLFLQHRPQVVISDIRMPEMDGIEMCQAIRAVDTEVPIIIISAHTESGLLLDSIEFGVAKYIVKPVHLPALKEAVQTIANALGRRAEIEVQLKQTSAALHEAEYASEKLQSYVSRCMEMAQTAHPSGLRQYVLAKGELSGDFICHEQHGDDLYALLADGAGHGLPAVLPALQIPRIFRDLARRGFSLMAIADAINRSLHEMQLTEHFLAATLVRLNAAAGVVEVLNCGNPSAWLIDETGEVLQVFNSHTMALGMLAPDDFDADVQQYACTRKARLFVFSDGLPDAFREAGRNLDFTLRAGDVQTLFERLVRQAELDMPAVRHDDISLLELHFDGAQPQQTVAGIPVVAQSSALPELSEAEMGGRLRNLVVLLVEEDEGTLNYLARHLGRHVGSLHLAHSGDEGLHLFSQHRPQVVVAGAHLALQSGVSMVEAMRELNEDVQVVLISESLEMQNVEAMLGLNVNRFLPKPFNVDKLLTSIQDCAREFDSAFGMKLSASVFMTSPLAISITNRDREIITVNPAFCRITGYLREEVIGRNPRLLASGRHDAAFYRKMWQSINETGSWSGEIWNRRKSGELYLEWITINVVRDRAGEVSHYVAIFSDATERSAAEAKMRHLAQHDSLTDLPNRVLLQDRAQQALVRARREGKMVAVMMLDIDHFKTINDSFGHSYGDELLRNVAGTLLRAVRESDTVCRLGGDEFAILLFDGGSRDMIGRLAGKIIAALNQSRLVEGNALQIGCSVGVSLFPGDGEDIDTLLKHADSAMYASKRGGRNHYQFFDHQHERQDRRNLAINQGIRTGLQNGEFSMVYQPQYSSSRQRIVGMEALVRWNNPLLGAVSPAEFIPLAEESGFIVDIGEWVIDEVFRQMAAWLKAGVPVVPVSINISPLHFRRGNVTRTLLQALERYAVSPALIRIELTESVVMNHSEATLSGLHELKNLGFRISIDDFGTGYSSLSYLRHLPIDELKIDRSFIMEIGDKLQAQDPSLTAVPLAIIQLARTLGFSVVAEGVEVEVQQSFLSENGCDVIQGYLISRPIPAEQMCAMLGKLSAGR